MKQEMDLGITLFGMGHHNCFGLWGREGEKEKEGKKQTTSLPFWDNNHRKQAVTAKSPHTSSV